MRENRMEVVCSVCPHYCRLMEGQRGRCGVRRNEKGEIVCDNYGKITALALDPIEKKPLRQFLPGSLILSVGSFGCNLSCPFCQNHEISMPDAAGAACREITPEELAELAADCCSRGDGYERKNIGVAYTYNEPLVGYEFVRNTAELVREKGMKNVLVTNGTAEISVLEELLPYIDAMNIDLKGFSEAYYRLRDTAGRYLKNVYTGNC